MLFAGPPFPPTDMRTSCVTAKSVVLGWFPGPDGGYDQTFSVKYRMGKGTFVLYKDGIKDTKNERITVKMSMLQPDAEYEGLVTAHNVIGDSQTTAISFTTRGMNILYESITNWNYRPVFLGSYCDCSM